MLMLPCERLNPAHDPATCNACRVRDSRGTRVRGAKPVPKPAATSVALHRRNLPCIHEGAVLEWCNTCSGDKRHVRDCDMHERCTRGHVSQAVRSCAHCSDYDDGTTPRPLRRSKLDSDRLAPGAAGARFNAGLIRWKGRLLLAYRTGWAGAQIHVTEMDEGYVPGPSVTLPLFFPRRANYGREDPRLFEHNGKLHVSYIGVSGKAGPTHQMYAVLNDDLTVEKIHYPHYEHRQPWEKNWAFFSHSGQLYAVYSVSPHVVLRVDGEKTEEVAAVDWSPKWSGGYLRGGASPVRVGNEWWHWFHGRVGSAASPVYNYGVVAFQSEPPFAPVAYTPTPLYTADRSTRPKDQYCPVIFPCGAVKDGPTWKVSCGVHDRWIEIHEWDHDRVSKAMVRL